MASSKTPKPATKPISLRIPEDMHDDLVTLADIDLRSVNNELMMLIRSTIQNRRSEIDLYRQQKQSVNSGMEEAA